MNINAMMKQAKKIQLELDKARNQIFKKEFKIEKQGLTVIMLGNRQIQKIEIDSALIDPEDKELVEDLLIVTLNQVNAQIDQELEAIEPKSPNMPL